MVDFRIVPLVDTGCPLVIVVQGTAGPSSAAVEGTGFAEVAIVATIVRATLASTTGVALASAAGVALASTAGVASASTTAEVATALVVVLPDALTLLALEQ